MDGQHITMVCKWTANPGKLNQLTSIAVPGPFFFCGDVPQELKDATEQMQLWG